MQGEPIAKRSQVRFQKGMSLSAFQLLYGAAAKCAEAPAHLLRPPDSLEPPLATRGAAAASTV
ncbi:MAG: hypothetical protein OXI87_20730 [Albidovulum sp.]|nr:hypothetical protein [Albidovulum sp.]